MSKSIAMRNRSYPKKITEVEHNISSIRTNGKFKEVIKHKIEKKGLKTRSDKILKQSKSTHTFDTTRTIEEFILKNKEETSKAYNTSKNTSSLVMRNNSRIKSKRSSKKIMITVTKIKPESTKESFNIESERKAVYKTVKSKENDANYENAIGLKNRMIVAFKSKASIEKYKKIVSEIRLKKVQEPGEFQREDLKSIIMETPEQKQKLIE